MRLKTMLLGAAAGLLALAAGSLGAPSPFPATPARADTALSFSIGTFYDRLTPYGSWTSYHGANVFLPTGLQDGWRPYTRGHWVYTRQYAWLWVSDEPFGWATYHYGRWAYADDIGWYWVPGTRWAPAWVSWRRAGDNIVWAPLAPVRGADDIVAIDVVYPPQTPDFFWIAVPTRAFLAPDLSVVEIRDERLRRQIIETAAPPIEVTVRNNVVVNTAINVDVIEQATRRKVAVVDVRDAARPEEAGRTDASSIAVFHGDVRPDAAARPAKLVPIQQVRQIQASRKLQPTVLDQAQPANAGRPGPDKAGAPAPVDEANHELPKPKPDVVPPGGDRPPKPDLLTKPETATPVERQKIKPEEPKVGETPRPAEEAQRPRPEAQRPAEEAQRPKPDKPEGGEGQKPRREKKPEGTP